MKKYLFEILSLLGPDKWKLPALLIFFIFASMLDLLGISLIGPYIGLVVDPQSKSEVIAYIGNWMSLPKSHDLLVIVLGLILLTIFFLKTITALWVYHVIIKFSTVQQIRLKSLLMKKFQFQPYTTYLAGNSSESVHSIQKLVDHYTDGVVTVGMKILSDAVVVLAIIILLAWINIYAVILLIGLTAVFVFGYDKLFRVKIKLYGKKSNLASINVVKAVSESMEGLKEVRILGREKYFYNQVRNSAKEFGRYYIRSTILTTAPRYLLEFIMVLFIVALVTLLQVYQKNLDQLLPTLSAFGIAAIRLIPSINTFSTGMARLRFNRDSVSRLYLDVVEINKFHLKNNSLDGTKIYQPFNSFELEHVNFRYPSAKQNTLNDVSLKINTGEVIGLIGSSGSGKSTLIDVILGILQPQEGKALYNKNPLRDKLKEWQCHIAYLPQKIFLIDSTLKKNIALGVKDKEIDNNKLIDALERAHLTKLVEQLHKGVDTPLGEGGIRISGGQKQRVALARAFYHGRDVLIMDEAKRALDNQTEREIVEEIKRLKGSKTIIIVAHRMSTLKYCDVIYEIKGGILKKGGTYNEIVSGVREDV